MGSRTVPKSHLAGLHTGQFILLLLEKRYDERTLGGVRKVRAKMLNVVHTWDQKACVVGRWLTVLSLSLPTLMSPQASEMRLKHPISSLPLPKKRRGEDGPSSLGRLYLQPFAPKGGRGKLRIFYEESHFPRVPPSKLKQQFRHTLPLDSERGLDQARADLRHSFPPRHSIMRGVFAEQMH